jgi:hypothetical protein
MTHQTAIMLLRNFSLLPVLTPSAANRQTFLVATRLVEWTLKDSIPQLLAFSLQSKSNPTRSESAMF